MAATRTKPNGANRVPTTIRPISLRRLQCVKQHLDPVPDDIDFVSAATDKEVRRIMRRKRVTLPPECAFSSSSTPTSKA